MTPELDGRAGRGVSVAGPGAERAGAARAGAAASRSRISGRFFFIMVSNLKLYQEQETHAPVPLPAALGADIVGAGPELWPCGGFVLVGICHGVRLRLVRHWRR